MNILDELYYGNLDPNSKSFIRNSEYGKFVKIISENEEKLQASLSDEQKQYFSQFINAQDEVHDTDERERFIIGFQLGARFMLDTFLIPRGTPVKGTYE